jgi:CRISPR-associated exonuclease Cas4
MNALVWIVCGFSVLVALLMVFRARRGVPGAQKASTERASRPAALLDAELLYIEKSFRLSRPVHMVAKLDRAYRKPSGFVVLVEFKSRRIRRPFQSDVIQLSAQRMAVADQTRQNVGPYGYVVVKTPSRAAQHTTHRVELMSEEVVVAFVRRRQDILANRVEPRYAESKAMCRTCAFRSECDGPHLAVSRRH